MFIFRHFYSLSLAADIVIYKPLAIIDDTLLKYLAATVQRFCNDNCLFNTILNVVQNFTSLKSL